MDKDKEIDLLLRQLMQEKRENDRLREALRSIARNTCCNGCREAALVARAALGEEK